MSVQGEWKRLPGASTSAWMEPFYDHKETFPGGPGISTGFPPLKDARAHAHTCQFTPLLSESMQLKLAATPEVFWRMKVFLQTLERGSKDSPFCSFTPGRWDLMTWLDSVPAPYCWRSDASRKMNDRLIWMTCSWRSHSAADGRMGISTRARGWEDSSARLGTFGADRRCAELA